MESYCARVSNIGVHEQPCLFELTADGESFAYERMILNDSFELGDPVMVQTHEQSTRIKKLHCDTYISPFKLPYTGQVETVNYSGMILDCYDPVFGIYNWDNQAVLFTCGMLLNIELHKKYTFENLHCVSIEEIQGGTEWLQSIIGCPFPTAFGVIFVYCPVYSNLKGAHLLPKPELSTKADFASLLAAYMFLKKSESVQKSLIDFQFLEKFASAALNTNYDVSFSGHCASCQFTQMVSDHSSSLASKFFFQSKQVKDLMIDLKSGLKGKVTYGNTAYSRTRLLSNEILIGRIKVRSRNVYEFFDFQSSAPVTLIDCNETIPWKDEEMDLIAFNAHVIVEMIPRLQYANAWSTKAYIWLSNIAKVVCRSKVPKVLKNDFNEFKLLRKYSQLVDNSEAQFIEVQNTSTGQKVSKALKAEDKFYGLIAEKAENDSIFTLLMAIDEAALRSSKPLKSDFIRPILKPKIDVSCDQFGKAKTVSVHLDDLSILSSFIGIKEFSVKVRIYAIKEALFTLKCIKCNIQIKGRECLMHKSAYVPLLQLKVAFVIGDDLDGRSSILIENFDHLCIIMAWKPETVQKQLEKALADSGEIRFSSDELSLLEPGSTFLQKAIGISPYRSRIFKLTFPFKVLKSVLKPSEIEICDVKIEILNLIRLFDSQMSLIK